LYAGHIIVLDLGEELLQFDITFPYKMETESEISPIRD
jgi:hypothetical protein